MLYKVREFVNNRVLKLIDHAIFDYHLNYANTVWVQNKISVNHVFLLKKKAFRIISSECRNAHSKPLFYRPEIIKSLHEIIFKDSYFISKSINFDLPSIFHHQFTFSSNSHRYEAFCSSKGNSKVKKANTKKYSGETLINSAISSWKDIQKKISSHKMLHDVPTFKLKS